MTKHGSHPLNGWSAFTTHSRLWAVPVAAAIILLFTERAHFVVFHTLAELFPIVIAFMLFSTAWTTSRFKEHSFLTHLGCGYVWVGLIHLSHTLSYKGLFIESLARGDLASEFWVAARYMEAITLLGAIFLTRKRIDKHFLLLVYGLIAMALCGSIALDQFPKTFVEGKGLTPFKVYSEYVVIGAMGLAIALLYRKRPLFDRTEVNLVVASIAFGIVAELMFTLYVDVYGLSNLLGHLFKLTSFWLLYQAVVTTNLIKPYEDLEDSRNYNRKLFDSSAIGLVLMRMDGTFIDVNPSFARMIGRRVHETLGLTYKDISPDDCDVEDQRQLDTLRETGRYGPYTKHYLHKDGHRVPVQLSGTLIDRNGEPHIWSSVEDISKRLRAESELEALSSRIQKIATQLPGFIYQFRMRPDGTMHIPYASTGISTIYGLAPEEVAEDAAAAFERIHPDDLPHVKQRIAASAESLTVWHEEFRIVLPNGENVWVDGQASPSKEDDGSIVWHGFIQNIAERINARQELVRQRDRLHEYIDLARALVLALNRDGEIVLINDYACSVLGYEKSDLTDRNWFDVALPADIRDAVREKGLDILQGRRPPVSGHEKVVQTRTGERRLISWSYAYLYGESMNIDGVLASGMDITDERQSKLDLERSNRALQTISRCNEVMVHAENERELLKNICRSIVEEGGYLLAWTAFIRDENGPHYEKTASFGLHQDIIEGFLLDLSVTDTTPAMGARTFNLRNGNPDLPSCNGLVEKTGIEAVYMLPLQEEGQPIGGLFLAADDGKEVDDLEREILGELTDDLSYGIHALRIQREREYVLERLSQSEARNKAVIEGAYDAIIAINDAGHITQFNPAAQAMFGYTSKEILGEEVHVLMPEHYRAAHGDAIQRYAETRVEHVFGQNLLLAGVRSNGQEFPIELTLSPMPEGMPDLCTAIIRDISEREEAERHRRQVHNMESIGNLAGGMAHDINNMLLPILNLTASVQRTLGPDTKEGKKLDMVLQAADRVKDLVHRVLEFSRQEEAEFKEQDIHDILDKVMPLLKSTTPSSIDLSTDIEDFTGIVHADEKQITAVLINLMSNAADAIGGVNGKITIQLKKVVPTASQLQLNSDLRPIGYAKLSVVDDGCGMSKNVLERIFDPFFTTKEPGHGTGLGMSMAHGVITKHGGALNVSSAEGQGSQVDVYLPLLSGTDETASQAAPHERGK